MQNMKEIKKVFTMQENIKTKVDILIQLMKRRNKEIYSLLFKLSGIGIVESALLL